MLLPLLVLSLGHASVAQDTCTSGDAGVRCGSQPRPEDELAALVADDECTSPECSLNALQLSRKKATARSVEPDAAAKNSTASADCADSGCGALGLEGLCCPNADGIMLECCGAAPGAAPVKPPPVVPVDPEADCAKFEACAAAGLTGACCPNPEGVQLGCCAPAGAAPAAPAAAAPKGNGTVSIAACENYEGCAALGLGGNCCPNEAGISLGCCSGIAAEPEAPVLKPATVPGPLMTFYMYRVSNNETYKPNGVNMANLEGDLWYLHNEVVHSCPRKFNMSRLQRFKITYRSTAELNAQGRQFDAFVAFDKAKCTVPRCEQMHWDLYGYVVGCQPNAKTAVAMPGQPVWYSLPGTCPSKFYYEKSEECIKDEPGGLCPTADVTGTRDCTYFIEDAGEISLDELSGIENYNDNCALSGDMEYSVDSDKGTGTSFWNDKLDEAAGAKRIQAIQSLFGQKYPSMPMTFDEPPCP